MIILLHRPDDRFAHLVILSTETEEADSSEVTEESKNLQQSIQQDLSTETTPAKKGVQAKKNFKPQTGTGPRGGKAKAPANRGRGGPRGKRAAN